MRILIVDDDADDVVEIVGIVQKAGHDFITAQSGDEGLKVALKEKPDIIISDIRMMKMDGYELLSELHKNQETKSIPVIAVTGFSEELNRLIDSGFYDYEQKPIDMVRLLKKINAISEKITESRMITRGVGDARPSDGRTQ